MQKPHKGRIEGWYKVSVFGSNKGLGYIICGKYLDHPEFAGKHGHTSYVVKHEGAEIETWNSRYTLVGEELKP